MINVVELFSGIGSQARAIDNVCKQRGEQSKILCTCDWDIHAIVAYDYIHKGPALDNSALKMTKEELLKELLDLNLSCNGKTPISKRSLESYNTNVLRIILSSIRKTKNRINIMDVTGEEIPNDTTILTYSFPCQDLSNVGALHGYNKGIDRGANTRSGLLWEVERILLERREKKLPMPKFLLLENVISLEAKRHRGNFEEWKNQLEKLGYINCIYHLYASNFGIPQNRRRLLMLSIYVGSNKTYKTKVQRYLKNHNLEKESSTFDINTIHLEEFLRTNYKDKLSFKEAKEAQPNDTPSRQTIWDKNSKILTKDGKLAKMVQTITTKQDRHPNSGNLYFDYKGNIKAKYRFLTARECFLLMGFKDADYDILMNNNFAFRKNSQFFTRDRIYKLAGNTIVVNMLEGVFNQVLDILQLAK